MKRQLRGFIILLIFICCIIGLAYYSFGILKGTIAKDESGIELGLDLSGGLSITYEAEGDVTAEEMSDTVYKMQQRAAEYSSEANVYQAGDDRITVEIPGITDAEEILSELGSPGSLEFQTEDGESFLTGDMIADAQAGTQEDETTGATEYVVELTFTDEGAEIFSEYTSENVGNTLPIYYDDECISSPTVQEAITDGSAVITGMDSYEDAEELASLIRIGSLSAELTELQSEVVGATLGEEALSGSIYAAVIGVFLIIAFLILIYFMMGVAASAALLLYCGCLLSVLHLYDITLTLPGIAGIILSVGMAVDANVVIFSRIREEIFNGKRMSAALDGGFKKARSAILDGNITTLIAGVILWIFGSGTVRSFAVTLIIGILLSMFTAFFLTRWILMAFLMIGIEKPKFYVRKKREREKSFSIIGKRKAYFGISLALIAACVIGIGVNLHTLGEPLNFGLEFAGGTQLTVDFEEEYTLSEIEEDIEPYVEQVAEDVQVQTVDDSTDVIFKTETLSEEDREEVIAILTEEFDLSEDAVTYTSISGTISSEMQRDAILAVIVAVICMLLYIRLRFRTFIFAVSAILCLIHDVVVVLACYAIFRITVGTTFIACMLTLLGYSINATIVIFDRLRENLPLSEAQGSAAHKKGLPDLAAIADRSITETFGRSINTTITTFIMVLLLFILGVSDIRTFAFPLSVGILCGMYSSVCLAGSFWYLFESRKRKSQSARSAK